MSIVKKLKSLILPEKRNFFSELHEQSKLTQAVIDTLIAKYYSENKALDVHEIINKAKNSRKDKLKILERAFITPVDREAISRAYSHLYWIALSVEHLLSDMEVFEINNLKKYSTLLNLLQEQMIQLTKAFKLLGEKKFSHIIKKINHVIHLDNMVIREYAGYLNTLFDEKNLPQVHKERELLFQLKEISKRIHVTANLIEDIVFKME